ncbi:hypothetical protein BKI52_41270 [marine bacterium AO1-C]|nr:hypothetical protein BKI52_41270 [marine bacterium AO1-C]
MSNQNTIPVRPLVSSTRDSLDVTLEVKQGTIPQDLSGYVFINTPNGTVNSAFPYPKTHPDGTHNQEYSSPLLGGAGYIFKFDLTEPGVVKMQTNLLKPPSYYADEATKYGTSLYKLFGFRNWGIARLSLLLGAAAQIATTVIPVRFKGEATSRLLAGADLGRAYEFNGETLDIIAPIGKLSDYEAATPAIVPWIFKLIEGTAHPTFDPVTQELFTVNYTKSVKTLLQASGLLPMLKNEPEKVEKLIEEVIDEMNAEGIINKTEKVFDKFLLRLEKKIEEAEHDTWFGRLIAKVVNFFKEALGFIEKETTLEDTVYLLRFTDRLTNDRWRVVDEQGENIKIWQCMHQTSLSQDYVLLIDAAFKLTIDVLLNNPFPNNPKIDAFLREHTTSAQLANTPMYIIKRSDLVAGNETVTAKKLTLKPEFIHFTANYANTDNLITIYTASNAAACLAEWVRYYDQLLPGVPIEEGTEGVLCVGSMDVGRVGKVVIDPETATIKEEVMLHETGDLNSPGDIGPHTWLSGFYTFRDFISSEVAVNEIKNIYWQFGALEQRRLTKFIFDLYKDYPNRIVPVEDIEKFSEKGVPLQIARLNTDTMKLEDYYQYPDNYTLGAIQFVPRRTPNEAIDPSMDGYLFTTMINGVEEPGNVLNYLREVWIFDAVNLAQGPVCTLTHPAFDFGFTLHSLWTPNLGAAEGVANGINAEFEDLINKVEPEHREKVREIFEKHVYPNFG